MARPDCPDGYAELASRPIGFGAGIPYRETTNSCIGKGVNDATKLDTTTSLETELLALMASQAKQVLVPVFLVSGMIASFAAHYVPRQEWIVWLAAVLAILIVRATVIPMLLKMPNLPRRGHHDRRCLHGAALGRPPNTPERRADPKGGGLRSQSRTRSRTKPEPVRSPAQRPYIRAVW